jgi:hypothetical protein
MFLFDLLFGGKKSASKSEAAQTAAPAPQVSAPGTRISHDPALIATLKDDHQLLLQIFGAIGQAAKSGDLGEVEKRLNHFRTVLMDHLLKENVRLYVYLEHLLIADPPSRQLIHEFRHEMDAIGKVVVGFLGKYKTIASQPELTAGLNGDLAAIGEALVARIQREEGTLYPMYQAPN